MKTRETRVSELEDRVKPGKLLVIEGVDVNGPHWYNIMTGELLLELPEDAKVIKRFGLSLIDL